MSVKASQQAGKGNQPIDTDAAIAAADLLEKLQKGKYTSPSGKKLRINSDASKLPFAVDLAPLQRTLLQDFRFSLQRGSRDAGDAGEVRATRYMGARQFLTLRVSPPAHPETITR